MWLKPIVIGDTTVLRFYIEKADCSGPQDLSLFNVFFFLKRSKQDPNSSAIWSGSKLGLDIVLDDQTDISNPGITGQGMCNVTIPSSATARLREGRKFYWSITIVDVDLNQYTPDLGTVIACRRATDVIASYS
jgi:hypothetical protein